ncbi:hypothetical protein PLICRDRAFT_54239 [Plicaturopsis crispa FD-325 SS-3]|nr:hypothetical protein PLICRDRAFT_54239 [Plicaturopsis crispa FD-325 SS-3]
MSSITKFQVDAVLFDMDGTLTDSISAVEAAWGKVAADIGQDPAFVIAATHGKRAIDNLKQFKPHIRAHEMEAEVEAFEQSILFYADAFHRYNPRSQGTLPIPHNSLAISHMSSPANNTPTLSAGSTAPSSRRSSATLDDIVQARRASFGTLLTGMLETIPASPFMEADEDQDPFFVERIVPIIQVEKDVRAAWQVEAAGVDRSVHILPGVKKMIESIPAGRYAVATSGARTYAYGCMNRVGIVPPPVTITACDKRLKAGKPAPDPFLLAAECLGFEAKNCVVFEDSPSGIKAGIASGAIVIAVCTSHERSKIEGLGAHFVVDTMECIKCEATGEGAGMKLNFTITV